MIERENIVKKWQKHTGFKCSACHLPQICACGVILDHTEGKKHGYHDGKNEVFHHHSRYSFYFDDDDEEDQ